MMHLPDALAVVRAERRPEDVVVTTMSAARVWTEGGIGPRDFVFVPSCMGHASSLALGIALAQPARRVVVCNGDGSLLMSLGTLVTIASQAPANLVMLVLDNGVYEVTGSQPLPSRADFAGIARASGIRAVHEFRTLEEWQTRGPGVLRERGPVVAVLAIQPDPTRPAPKSPGPAAARARAFMDALRD